MMKKLVIQAFIAILTLSFFSPVKADIFPPDDASVNLPLHISENRIIVELELEGIGIQHFIIDMAASGGVISPALKNQLSLSPNDIRIDTVQGASGMRLMEFVYLPEIRFAGQSFTDMDAVVFETNTFRDYDGVNVQGILGVDVLQHFDLSLDLSKNEMKLKPLDQIQNDKFEKENGIDFESNIMPGFVEFEIEVNGTIMNAFLDTGGKRSILNWKAAQALGITKDHPKLEVREAGTKGIDGGKQDTFLYTFNRLNVGPASLTDAVLKIADLSVFEVMGYSDGPVMLIGIDFLQACSIEVSYSTNQLYLCSE